MPVTDAGKQWLEQAVSSIDSPVYALSTRLESLTIAAAMARWSSRSDTMRLTLLDTPQTDDIVDSDTDSPEAIIELHMIVEDASQLLARKLGQGGVGAHVEQGPRRV